jgi:hypothetical protein
VNDLYDSDILLWSERQAALLRRRAAGELVNDAAEAVRFRQEALDLCSPSMRQRLDLGRMYGRAVRQLPDTIGGQDPLPIPATCPATLDELLAEDGP